MMKQTINSPIRKLKLLFILPLIAGVFYAFAAPEYKYSQAENNEVNAYQNIKTLTGKVVQEDGKPLKGAKIVVSGNTTGTVTDINGNFKLEMVDDAPIVISYVGFGSQKVAPDFEKEMVITLKTTNVGIEMEDITTQTGISALPEIEFDNATILVNEVEIPKAAVENLDPDLIKSVNVVTGNSAISKYGDKGKNGVVEITLKDETFPDRIISRKGSRGSVKIAGYSKDANDEMKLNPNTQFKQIKFKGMNVFKHEPEPLIVLDGVITENNKLENNISPENFEAINVLKGDQAISKYGDKGKNGVVEITMKKIGYSVKNESIDVKGNGSGNVNKVNIQKESQPYSVVEQMPEFPGGEEALRSYIAANVKYPALATQKGIQGKVFINFVVTKIGSVTNAKVVRGVDPSLDQEAMRVVESLPNWIPGKQNGEYVDVMYTIPINFVLEPSKISTEKLKDTGNQYDKAYSIVEQMPEFPGGDRAFRNFLATKIRYPTSAHEKGIQGKVYIKFVVTKTGTVTNIEVVQGIDPSFDQEGLTVTTSAIGKQVVLGVDPSLDREAIRVITLMPTWKPGMQNGKNVDVYYTIPINFKLEKAPEKETKTTADQTIEIHELIIVPNPTSDKATITLKGSDSKNNLDVSVYDSYGKLISKESKNGPSFTLSVAKLTTGTYLVVAIDGTIQFQGHLVVNH